jgi:hypothetical protein
VEPAARGPCVSAAGIPQEMENRWTNFLTRPPSTDFHRYKLAPAHNNKMGKRSVFEANPKAAHTGHHAKRQRTDGSHDRELQAEGTIADVTSAQQLQRTLVFDQGNVAALRQGRP